MTTRRKVIPLEAPEALACRGKWTLGWRHDTAGEKPDRRALGMLDRLLRDLRIEHLAAHLRDDARTGVGRARHAALALFGRALRCARIDRAARAVPGQ